MRTRLSNLAVVVSLTMLVAVALLWVRSYSANSTLSGTFPSGAYRITSADGRLTAMRCALWGMPLDAQIVWDRDELDLDSDESQIIPPKPIAATRSWRNGWGFGRSKVEVSTLANGIVTDALFVPYWFEGAKGTSLIVYE